MGYIDSKHKFLIEEMMDSYSYYGVECILKRLGIDNGELFLLVSSCKYAVNFDFETALERVNKIPKQLRLRKDIKLIANNLMDLTDGDPEAIFCEFIENIKIKLVQEDYIDFLARIYRLKEALLKYIFVTTEFGKKDLSMLGHMVSKKNIMIVLRKKYKIYNPNLNMAINQYIAKNMGRKRRIKNVMTILNSYELEGLINLRHESPVGHGFRGVSRQDIEMVYGNPVYVMKDFIKVCEILDLEIKVNKYDSINETIKTLIEKYS